MKTRRTLFVMIMALLVLSLMAGCALADDKLYTSEPFKIPADQVAQPEEVPEEPEAEPEGPAAGPESGEVIPEGTASAPEGTEPETPSEGTETLPEEGQLPEELPEGTEGAEGADGVFIVLQGHIGAAQLVKGLPIIGGRRRGQLGIL